MGKEGEGGQNTVRREWKERRGKRIREGGKSFEGGKRKRWKFWERREGKRIVCGERGEQSEWIMKRKRTC